MLIGRSSPLGAESLGSEITAGNMKIDYCKVIGEAVMLLLSVAMLSSGIYYIYCGIEILEFTKF